MAQCGTCVNRLYKSVIEEVIAGVKESFLDEGIDDQVLADLKQQWEAKLAATKAAEHQEISQQHQQTQQQQQAAANQLQQQQQSSQPAQPVAQSGPAMALVPVQITVPSQQAGGVAKTITIHVPSTALSSGIAGPQLQSILSSPAAAQTFALEASQAAEIIQRQLNTALQANGVVLPPQLLQYSHPVSNQVDGPAESPLGFGFKSRKSKGNLKIRSRSNSKVQSFDQQNQNYINNDIKVVASTEILDKVLDEGLKSSQIDGAYGLGDSSDEISDDDDDDDDDEKDDEKKEKDFEDDDDVEDEAWNDDPLNSDDDVSEEDGGDIFETENVVVCQYDKITRVRNKWKFHLKDGIMNLKGKDYVFTKANGEGEW